jgi:hypothetical protein
MSWLSGGWEWCDTSEVLNVSIQIVAEARLLPYVTCGIPLKYIVWQSYMDRLSECQQ